ncbi:MAG: zinc ABC transporter solute-binding protein [Gemmatimonadetes bacterium]|nr:zinc ABC transporter substrate-binding protein [Gemmatimonadota bacterium]NIR80392.1 zinc ABC transporter substrate-binding protein [Gemmatimonadota bacterium]NIT89152.1 zinc ABC transporter substrate-binding protein [Gemmatimonadota bacterium]NIU32952.1 zinc ABC transporter substrate-binding protein [Gemmatimonadota bacterium]NIU37344.1 zinc ABC transporter solute-binding protein [Gemmatimonadota bacterium]
MVASIFPLADLARRVGGRAVEVEVLLPPRASPATFEITPREIRTVSGARLYLAVGGGLDAWATDLVEASSDLRVVVLTRGMELMGEGRAEGTGNPHVWLDPVRVRDDLLPRLTHALAVLVPDSTRAIRARSEALADTLAALDREIRGVLETVANRAFVTTHPAWSYFAERYGLREVGTLHPHPGQEPSARYLAELVDEARRAGIRAIFSEPQLAGTAARALAAELGVPVLLLDPLGGPGVERRDGYPQLLRWNTRQLVRGLGGRAGASDILDER